MTDRQASIPEMRPLRTAAERYDVAILGGGLAGLTLAIQLKKQRPDTQIVVLEKREGPAPLAAFKVGESTVPSGAHYFADVVGMRNHLKQRHLIKAGLRFFLPTEDNSDFTKRIELGPREYPPQDNYQIDRGLFENELAAQARALGVDVLQGCRVQEVDFGSDLHTVKFTQAEADTSLQARWVVDAAGRASLLKRQLGAGEGGRPHHQLVLDPARRRARPGTVGSRQQGVAGGDARARASSVQHQPPARRGLLGMDDSAPSGPISIGVCADPRFHPFEEIDELDG